MSPSLSIKALIPTCTFNSHEIDSFLGGYNDFPLYWKLPLRFDMSPSNPIFKEVYEMFHSSMGHYGMYEYVLTRIEQICNKNFFNSYSCRRTEMQNDPVSPRKGEKWLWHGCSPDSVDGILQNGYHFGYSIPKALEGNNTKVIAGMRPNANINMWGIGSYFATEAHYSWESVYSTPGINNEKVLLLNRVLVGSSCLGSQYKRFPDNIGNSTTMCDSMTDGLKTPSLFVISSGGRQQIYTEFVLHFMERT